MGVPCPRSVQAGEEWDAFEAARQTMSAHLSSDTVAARYR